jgi:hypothetical protein
MGRNVPEQHLSDPALLRPRLESFVSYERENNLMENA